ncbi:MAG TPA: bifunctional ornithine acetyltransferase/N-acetylglutamate synthase [Bacillus sp. (in: firmicutes)]|uniref:bifunctional ornithine acetyltransferase/N-acetylglutamate synthase n=1 Tax=Bacillus litorisediminis TaxID=2922713 RepID=UPI001FAB4868|nr:bifunctional ornithine acetyltransferase/N-acetylglutamate synthase [Bacillus litorisediminis]HWO75764.1 bifunctional ornithine acetyltransferase/N-acetylglutamate synthase [Bacillus sp. (in: firmicutes)]
MQITKENKITFIPDGGVTSPKGFKAGGIHCGIKRKRLDLGFIVSAVPAAAAAVYTTNLFQAAPLLVTQESIKKEHKVQALIVNSGNANACTGEQGLKDAYDMQALFAEKLGIPAAYVAVASTGVIGVPLEMDKIKYGIEQINLPEYEAVRRFEQAILTTDTSVKHACVQLEIDRQTVTIGGAAKGSGMIHPNMATMLGFITTDAKINHDELLFALREVTNQTFNMITVDGDTSTNDMVLVMANGEADNLTLTKDHPEWSVFIDGLRMVSESLAKQIARDGEGATKLVEVQVIGAIDDNTARVVSKSIIGSSLVKTAVYGADPNWGRIVCAIGYSGGQINPNSLTVKLGPIVVVENGLPVPFNEGEAKAYLEQEHVHIFVDLKEGSGSATAWGCDLTYDYVKINASYRT